MANRIVTLCYRKIIDVSSAKPWDKMVFDDSYAEFRLQAQYFNQENKYRSFGELIHYVPGADKLHFLVSGAIVGYLQQLNGIVPDVANTLGRCFIKFTKFQFELINSDLHDRRKHQVAVNFFSEPLTWYDTIGDLLLVSEPLPDDPVEVLTHLLQLSPYLTIYSLRPA